MIYSGDSSPVYGFIPVMEIPMAHAQVKGRIMDSGQNHKYKALVMKQPLSLMDADSL